MANQTVVSVRDSRERAIAILSDLFAKDELDIDEFERRVNLVHRAPSVADVDKVLADLSVKPDAIVKVEPKPTPALVPAKDVSDRQSMVAILGGAERHGSWTSPRHLRVITVLGGAKLDFREARLAAGVTDVSIFCMLGGVEVIVPPELAVETSGSAILGGFEQMERSPVESDPDRPKLRIHGMVALGGFSVETRLVGESGWDAKRRRRRERRDQRKELKGRSK